VVPGELVTPRLLRTTYGCSMNAGVFAYGEDMVGGPRCLPQGRSRRSDLRLCELSSSSRTSSSAMPGWIGRV
jgi:hypothetical protein